MVFLYMHLQILFKRESEGKYEGVKPEQISGYKKNIEKFYQNVYGDSINFVKKILAAGTIEEMLELVFSSEKHYTNMVIFLSGSKEKYIMNQKKLKINIYKN